MQGQDVTLAVSNMGSTPSQAQAFGLPVEARGKVVLPQSVFQTMQNIEAWFSNARNAASGILLRKVNNQTLCQSRKFYAHDATDVRHNLITMDFLVPEPHILTMLRLGKN
jgi:NAD-dependent DNA ligase